MMNEQDDHESTTTSSNYDETNDNDVTGGTGQNPVSSVQLPQR